MALNFLNAAGHLFFESAGYLRLTWYPHARSYHTAIRPLLEYTLVSLRATACSKLLVDHRSLMAYGDHASWLLLDYIPRLLTQTPYQQGAYLPNTDVTIRNGMSYLLKEAHHRYGFPYDSFAREEQAVAWLTEKIG
ncbi:hypothetical protein [Hymenobacter sp. GOD-10R]|uniref:hypothetical protein n=1 Tax=Hymenobacter sp. GOD-10R TaxID=3093922 RepID=UPI002D7900C8|nr:hypothetical protein [Hymenobacter sp. GOD-10R]WRQ31639.1 hypothetical protein SD425_27795 [Hymenobacter sp. GOD-10R]